MIALALQAYRMNFGKVTSRQGLQVSAALGTKNLKKAAKKAVPKVPVAPGANRRGLPKGEGDGAPCIL